MPPRHDGQSHLLVGFAESLAAPETIWSLLDAGFRVTAFSRRGARPPIRRCRGLDIHYVEAPGVDIDASSAAIAEVARAVGADAIFPCDDEALWLCGELSAREDLRIIGPARRQLEFALDKRIQLAEARSAGFAVPETSEYGSAQEVNDHADALSFPLILKRALAVNATERAFVHAPTSICADLSELERALRAYPHDVPLLVQPWLTGHGEGVFGLMSGGEILALSAHRRIRMVDPHGSGSSACAAMRPDPDLAALTRQMLRGVGWNGLFMVELLRTVDTVWFTELNGRPWGSMALARRIGFEYPAWAAKEHLFQDRVFERPSEYGDVVCRHLGFEIAHLLAVLKGPRSRAVVFPSRARTIRDVCRIRRSDAWYNLRPGCRRVFADDTIQTGLAPIRRALERRLRGVSA